MVGKKKFMIKFLKQERGKKSSVRGEQKRIVYCKITGIIKSPECVGE